MTDLLLDTSVSVPLVMSSHVAHADVVRLIDVRTVALSGHALVETYAVLTRLPGDARVEATDAVRLLSERFDRPVVLDPEAALDAPARLASAGVVGGATYDGLVGLAAMAAGLPLATRDVRALGTYRSLGVDVELLT